MVDHIVDVDFAEPQGVGEVAADEEKVLARNVEVPPESPPPGAVGPPS